MPVLLHFVKKCMIEAKECRVSLKSTELAQSDGNLSFQEVRSGEFLVRAQCVARRARIFQRSHVLTVSFKLLSLVTRTWKWSFREMTSRKT